MEALCEVELGETLHHTNAVVAATKQQTVLMEQMIKMMNLMQHRMTQSPNTTRTGSKPHARYKTNKYCWMHGTCAHNSAHCKNKRPMVIRIKQLLKINWVEVWIL